MRCASVVEKAGCFTQRPHPRYSSRWRDSSLIWSDEICRVDEGGTSMLLQSNRSLQTFFTAARLGGMKCKMELTRGQLYFFVMQRRRSSTPWKLALLQLLRTPLSTRSLIADADSLRPCRWTSVSEGRRGQVTTMKTLRPARHVTQISGIPKTSTWLLTPR